MKDGSVKRWSAVHRVLFRMSGGAIGRRLVDNDILLLTTTGRASGEPHTVPLLYLSDGEDLIVIASYGGRDHNPDWYENLVRAPDVTVEVAGKGRITVRATDLVDEDRELWFGRAVEAYGGYAQYQTRTRRVIPVVRLRPSETSG